MKFGCPNERLSYIFVEEKYKFFVDYGKWLQQFRNYHYEALKTLKILWYPVLRQWTLPGLCIWSLAGGSQLLLHRSCKGNSLSCVGDRCAKKFSRIVPELSHDRDKILYHLKHIVSII